MARLQIVHTTRLAYDEPVNETVMETRLRPLDGVGQRCTSFRLDVTPSATLREYRDGFGNHVHYFNHLPAHREVVVTARSSVETAIEHNGHRDGDEFPEEYLGFRSPVLDLPGIRRMAERTRRDTTLESLESLTRHIHQHFEYRPEITDVYTAVDEVLHLRSGVCQDFAHLFVAAARAMGIPCRYVSGYIYPGGGRVGTAASHAWAEGWVDGRWLGLDPTNPVRADEYHVRVATGRDYRDVPPTRGVYLGRAKETMEVTVEVTLG